MTAAPACRARRPSASRAVLSTAALALAAATAGCASTSPDERPAMSTSPMWGAPVSAGTQRGGAVPSVDLRGFRIASRVGDAFEVRLPGFPSSGYRWTLVDPLPASVRALEVTRGEAMPGALAGAPTQEVWRFEGTGPGAGMLSFEFRRPNDPPSVPPAQRASYRVEIR